MNEDETRKSKDQVRIVLIRKTWKWVQNYFSWKVRAGLPIWEGEPTQQEDETYPSLYIHSNQSTFALWIIFHGP